MYSSLQRIDTVNQLVHRIVGIGNVVIYLLVGLGIIFIIWNVVQYFIKGKEGDESRHQAAMQVLWGIVGLAIIVSIWGLVNLILNTFWTDTTRPDLPNADFVGSNYGSGSNYGGNSGTYATGSSGSSVNASWSWSWNPFGH